MTTDLNPVQKYLLRLVLFGAGKTIQHKSRICEVVETHSQISRLLPIIDEDLSESKPEPFWVPRRPANRKQLRNERIRRQYVGGIRVAFSGLHYTGQARPVRDWQNRLMDRNSVPVEDIYREVPPETRRFLIHLGKPESRLVFTASWATRKMSVFTRLDNLKRMLRQQLNEKKKQFIENLVVETLRRSQMSDQRIAATYDVLVGGVAVTSAARQRGFDEGRLRQVVNRITRKVRPQAEIQLRAWLEAEEGVKETVMEIDALETQKSVILTISPGQAKRERVAGLR